MFKELLSACPPPRQAFLARKQVHHAFTLAEVLITLGIIGIVAALTLPTLIANHRKQVVVTKLKKFYSVMNQAINMTNAEYGDPSNWVLDCGTSADKTCTIQQIEDWFNTYIGKNLEILKTEYSKDNHLMVYLKDGSIVEIYDYIYDIRYYINVDAIQNGQSGKNTFQFRFQPIFTQKQISQIGADNLKYVSKNGLEPFSTYWDGKRDGLLNSAKYSFGCAQDGRYCAKLIQYDGWKISKDYPIKF